MKKIFDKFENNKFQRFIRKHKKYAPLIFFVGGFIFDTLTLGRIDRVYDLVVLCMHMSALTITLYLYNLSYDGKWKNTILQPYVEYFPLAIQFFFGGLSSAYVIYFSRSVSLSKTIAFFVILVVLLFANEFLKKRISNKYLQFSVYFFLNFTFFTFMVPVFIKEMNTDIFVFSGLASLILTLTLIIIIYSKSPNTRLEIHKGKIIGIISAIYITTNVFYFLKMIPPVPLSLGKGIVAYNIIQKNNDYIVTYEKGDSKKFWRDHKLKYIYTPGKKVYVFASIFAPTDINITVFHRWKWFNNDTSEWEITDDIGYNITGGRGDGYRGYTFKNNIKQGLWKVEVITQEELVIGVIDFEIVINASLQPKRMVDITL